MIRTSVTSCVLLLGLAATRGDDLPSVSPAVIDLHGLLVHEVESPFSAGKTTITALLPDDLKKALRYTTIYVLPVEAGNAERYGDGLLEIKKHGLHNKFQAIFVAPTFSHLPWYADHPTNTTIRQESHSAEGGRAVRGQKLSGPDRAQGRLLLGFSKSGWGAWSLLLRHPEVFGRAAAWDAPLMMDRVGSFGSGADFWNAGEFREIPGIRGAAKTSRRIAVRTTGWS